MSLPTMQEARSRQTAMEAERHWWVSRLREIIDTDETWLDSHTEDHARFLDTLEDLIAERTR